MIVMEVIKHIIISIFLNLILGIFYVKLLKIEKTKLVNSVFFFAFLNQIKFIQRIFLVPLQWC